MRTIWIKTYLFFTVVLFSNLFYGFDARTIMSPIPELNTRKTGLLIGVQRGVYNGIEFGWERQWKEIKLKNPKTFAFSAVGEYQFKANVLSFKAGPWMKLGRADFSYGANFVAMSDFRYSKLGVAPAIGFKFLGFHLQAGYNLLLGNRNFTDHNRLYLSLRYYISKDRKFFWKKEKKKS